MSKWQTSSKILKHVQRAFTWYRQLARWQTFQPRKQVNNTSKERIYSVEPTKHFAAGTLKGPFDSSEGDRVQVDCDLVRLSIGCDVSRLTARGSGYSCAFAGHEFFHHVASIAQATGQLFTAAELFDQTNFIGTELSLLVDVRHRSHQRTQNKLSVVLQSTKRNA